MINNKCKLVNNKLNKTKKALAQQVQFVTLKKKCSCVAFYTLTQSAGNNIR